MKRSRFSQEQIINDIERNSGRESSEGGVCGPQRQWNLLSRMEAQLWRDGSQ